MRVPAEQFQNTESGPCVIIGNGPSMNKYKGKEWACPAIGINLSIDYWPNEDYFVTVAFDRLANIAAGDITAKKAVFTCLHKEHAVPPTIPQPVVYADMEYDDIYATFARKRRVQIKADGKVGLVENLEGHIKRNPEGIFGFDLTKPTYKTFGGLFAVQVGFFLGFNPLYVVGFDGGTEHFKDYRRDHIPAEYHHACFFHVYAFLEENPQYKLYNCSEESKITWFPHAEPPLK